MVFALSICKNGTPLGSVDKTLSIVAVEAVETIEASSLEVVRVSL